MGSQDSQQVKQHSEMKEPSWEHMADSGFRATVPVTLRSLVAPEVEVGLHSNLCGM